MPPKTKSLSVPETMRPRYEEIAALTDALCREKLNDEYAQVCREMMATLARKRPSPLVSGHAKSWACAIAYTVGSVNFLFDKSQTPYLRADELCAWFGLSKSTGGNKSSQVKQILKVSLMDSQWTLPSRMDSNPLAWLVSVNGLIVDARRLPRSLQEEVYRKGLIPYLPDQGETSPPRQGETSLPFQVGDSVVVKQGLQDPDFGDDMSGWQGRVTEIDTRPPDPPLVTILWDSVTLRNISRATLARAEEEGLDWSTMGLYASEVELAASRDTIADVEATLIEIASHVSWMHLDEGGSK